MSHLIKHTHDRDQIISTFECTADESAPCHQYPQCDCEMACDHEPVANAECNVGLWMNDACARECYDGSSEVPVHDGPVLTYFDGDCFAWSYEDESAFLDDIPTPTPSPRKG